MRIEDLQGRQYGRYTITETLGRGGMAAVYRAHDTVLRRDVAFKVLYPHYANDPTLTARFKHEAVLAARLEHPNIVPIYDIGEDDGLVYIAMKLLHGRSLADLTQRRPQLPPQELLPIIEQIAAALDYAHANGVVHRDIKAANILLEPPDRAVLTDFGIAKSLVDAPNLTSTSMMIGTPDYMAPEQITRQPITPRTDIYALGVLTFRCLTGRRPFEGGTEQVLLGHLYGTPPAPTSLVPTLPPGVDDVVLAAIARDPAQRPASAGAFAQALRAALTNRAAPSLVRPAVRPTGAPLVAGAAPAYASADAATLVGPAAPPVMLPPVAGRAAARRSGLPVVAVALLALMVFGAAAALLAGPLRSSAGDVSPTAPLATSPAVGVVPTTEATASPSETPTEAPSPSPTETASPAPTTAPPSPAPATAPPSEPAPPTRVPAVPTRRPSTTVPIPPSPLPPTATPVPPTPTPPPPTATPVPPTPTPTPCPVAVVRGFGALLDAQPDVRHSLGCPIEPESGSEVAEQPFQKGSMLWFSLDKYIYVFYGRDTGYYQAFPPDKTVGPDEPPPDPPSPDLLRPVSGFGTVWDTHREVFNGLGWATAYEDGPFDGAYQPFENGLMLFSQTGLGRGPTIYVLFYDGRRFIRFADTFNG